MNNKRLLAVLIIVGAALLPWVGLIYWRFAGLSLAFFASFVFPVDEVMCRQAGPAFPLIFAFGGFIIASHVGCFDQSGQSKP